MLITCFSDFQLVDPFRRHLRSNLKLVKNGAEFWTFLPSHNLLGAALPKVVKLPRLPPGVSREVS